MSTAAVPRERAVDLGAGPGPVALMTAASLDPETLTPEALLDTVVAIEGCLAWAAAIRSCFLAEYASRAPVDPLDQTQYEQMEWHREQLAAATRTSPHEATVRCDTALALRDRLPATAAALTAGTLPWAQAVALAHETRDLDPLDSGRVERAVLPDPRAVSVRQVIRAARAALDRIRPAALAEEAATAWQRRSLVTWPAHDGLIALHAELPLDAAALLAAAIEPLAGRTGAEDLRTAEQRRADALVTLAGGDHPHPHVQVLVRAQPTGGLTDGRVDGEPVGPHTTRRLTCDSTLTTHQLDPTGAGAVLAPDADPAADAAADPAPDPGGCRHCGRSSAPRPPTAVPDPEHRRRLPGTALRRRLEIRDQSCAFPGCPVRATRCHAHHIRHWADGGPTTDANMTMLCSRHHHAAHEGGWKLAGEATQLTWTDQHGRAYQQPPATADIRPWPPDPPLLCRPDPAQRDPGRDPVDDPAADVDADWKPDRTSGPPAHNGFLRPTSSPAPARDEDERPPF